MLSLYQLCLQCLAQNSTYIASLEGLAYDPFVNDLVEVIYSKPADYLNANVLAVIGSSQGDAIRHATTCHYAIQISQVPLFGSGREQLQFIATSFPLFISKLDLSRSNIDDDNIWRLGALRNLVVLDLAANPITNNAVSHICHMNSKGGLLPHLQVLSVANNRHITDYALKFIPKLESVIGIDLSATHVSDVALTYLSKNGFRVLCASKDLETALNQSTTCPDHAYTLISWKTDAWCSRSTMTRLLDTVPNPGFQVLNNAPLASFINRALQSRTWGASQDSRYINDVGWWIRADVYKALCFVREQKRPEKRSTNGVSSTPKIARPAQSPKVMDDYLSMFESEFGMGHS